jgi:hypothetical protein
MTEKRLHYKLQFRTPSESARDSFKFKKRSQLFVRTVQRNAFRRRDARLQSRLFVARNPKLPPCPTPAGFAEIVSDYFPGPSCERILPLLRSTKQ